MLSLENKEWSEFCISEIFDVSNTKPYHKKDLKLATDINNAIPYITRTNNNNGVEEIIHKENTFKTNNKNTIAFGAENATFFLQPFEYITGNKVYTIGNDKLSKLNGLFIQQALNTSIKGCGFSYGQGLTGTRAKRRNVLLPIDDQLKPDYKYMDNYTKSIKDKKLEEYKKYANQVLANLEYKKVELLENKEWEEFFLTEIFSTIQRGRRLTKSNQKSGNIPYISSTSMNNGVDNFIGNKTNVRIFSDCLTIANSGSVGASFYQPYKFVASDHVTHLKKENMSKYVYMFISTLTNRFSEKYNFNREINDARISREKIMLPVNKKNQPDFEYMEQYMKNITYKKINQYLNYLEKKN